MSVEVENDVTSDPKLVEESRNKGGGINKILLIGVAVLLIILVAGLFFTSFGAKLFGSTESDARDQKKEEILSQTLDITKVTFTTLPEILLNLRRANGKSSFLKVTFVVQSSNEEMAKKVDKIKPIIVDQFQEYLRGLDVEDLAGAAGLQRLRSELLIRVNAILSPDKASDILISSFLIQ